MIYHVEIPGEPMPWKRVGQNRYNPSAEYQEQFANAFRMAVPNLRCDDGTLLWEVWLHFYSAVKIPGDWDNLAKNVCDALNGVVWKNDKMIRHADVKVIAHPRPRTLMVLRTIEPSDLARWSKL